MSDFFYKERLGPVFSPVINVKKADIPKAVVSAIDNLLSPSGNMFTRAETVRNLMKIESLSLEETAKALSLKRTDVAGKLRLLEFSAKERESVLEHGYSEADALEFLRLDKARRLYAMEYCSKSGFDSELIRQYIDGTLSKSQKQQKVPGVRKIAINDVGFFFNSVENVLKLAKKAGLEVENERSESEDSYDIHISVKKKNKS